ncbi:MAG TPA: mechanosensitive ion channel domain-containing protein [Stellaceae bacterium]|nr:mechanosensitive ion channel domain-containing protein [Stellaceae bacterium]
MIPWRIFRWLALALCAAAALGPLSLAEAQPQAPAAAQAPAPVSADELERLVNTLQDDEERGKLVEELRGLIAAQRGVEQKEETENPAAVLNVISAQIGAVSAEIVDAAAVVVDAPWLIGWFEAQVSDADARARWLERGLKLGIIFGAALLGEWLARTLMRRPRARLAARTNGGAMAQALLLVMQLVVELLPIAAFTVTAFTVLPLVQPKFGTAHVAQVVIYAVLWARGILAVSQVFLLSAGATLIPSLGEETRNYLYIWVRRFTNWAIYGYALATASWWLGIPGAIYVLLLRGTLLVLGVLSVVFVLQNRAAVAEFLRGKPPGPGESAAQGHGWRLLRQRLADTWHILAIIYLAGTFGTYVLRIESGFAFILRATLLSLVVIVAAGIIVRAVKRLSERGFAVSADLKTRFPTLEQRANRYLPVLTVLASAVVYSFMVLALLQAWGIDAFAWFSSAFGRKIAGSAVSIGTVVVVALLLWELFGAAVERYLNGVGYDGRPVARSARTRTLLPLLRTTVFIFLATIVTFIVLSALGVDIAPLLAGAGVAGIAIGFGSQALVKDVITGLFILLEDTLAVGEVVDVGKGHVGTVEAISIRAIKLRDIEGTVHTVPFSEVSTVRNMTRDYSYFVADVGVLYREDPDRVVAVLREVADELRRDAAWAPFLMAPLDVVGVDKFTDSAMVIRVRLKTVPLKQWPLGREFNRRMKKAFDQHGIEMPAANQTRYLEEHPADAEQHDIAGSSKAARA